MRSKMNNDRQHNANAAAEHDADDSLNGVFAHMLLPVFPDLYFFVLRG
jgi:hypothetical protein